MKNIAAILVAAFVSVANADHYQITAAGSGDWLRASGDTLILDRTSASTHELWDINRNGDLYSFQNVATGGYISCQKQICKVTGHPQFFAMGGSKAGGLAIKIPVNDLAWTVAGDQIVLSAADGSISQGFTLISKT